MTHHQLIKRALFEALYGARCPAQLDKLDKMAFHTEGHRILLGSMASVLEQFQGSVLIELRLAKVDQYWRLILRVTQYYPSTRVPGEWDRETTTYRFNRQDKLWIPAWIGEAYTASKDFVWLTDDANLPVKPESFCSSLQSSRSL